MAAPPPNRPRSPRATTHGGVPDRRPAGARDSKSMEVPAPVPGPIVLYDGVCGLCNRAIGFVLARDPGAIFRFASLQGDCAARIFARHPVVAGEHRPDSLLLVEAPGTAAERIRVRSDAVLGITERLPGGLWQWSRWLRAVPRPIRDGVYDLVARIRYRIFGRLESCVVARAVSGPVSGPEIGQRFLD